MNTQRNVGFDEKNRCLSDGIYTAIGKRRHITTFGVTDGI